MYRNEIWNNQKFNKKLISWSIKRREYKSIEKIKSKNFLKILSNKMIAKLVSVTKIITFLTTI